MNTVAVNAVNTTEREGRARPRKSSAPELRGWDEVDQKLACLGEVERQIRGLRDDFEEKVAVLKQQLLDASEPMISEKEKFAKQIERYYWTHRAEVLAQGRKSLDLAFGRVGSRSSRGVVVEDAAAAQQWLAGNGLGKYLRQRTELDREALRSAILAGNGESGESPSLLCRCPGVRLRESEEFWYEVDRAACDRMEGRPKSPEAAMGTVVSR